MAAARRVEREWLDELPAADPRAIRSRRDLRRVNALMANAGIVAGALRDSSVPLRRVAEIGAGDASFALRLARTLPRPATGAEMLLLDRQPVIDPVTTSALAALGWQARWLHADVLDWLRSPESAGCDAIVANLFLHHFEDAPLADMLRLLSARTRLFIACEPRRSALALGGSRLLGLIGCNDVTRHDAVASVRAGFLGGEIGALWPSEAPHALDEGPRGVFSHGFVARAPRERSVVRAP